MKPTERIIFVAEAKLIFRGSALETKTDLKTGLMQKKIVVTTQKLYVFKTPNHDADDFQYRLQTKSSKKKQEPSVSTPSNKPKDWRDLSSVTGEPQDTIPLEDRICKVVDEEQPSVAEFIRNQKIFQSHKNVRNSVLLLSATLRTVQFFFFDRIKDAFRFAKAVHCCNAWMLYAKECKARKVKLNYNWVSIVQDAVYDEDAELVVDPLEFNDPSQEDEMSCFNILVNRVSFISRLKIKFKIRVQYGIQCANKFMAVEAFSHLRGLTLQNCQLNDGSLAGLEVTLKKLVGLQQINLGQNMLTDQSLNILARMPGFCSELAVFGLEHNSISLQPPNLFGSFLRALSVLTTLDLCHNKIGDTSIEFLEKSIIYAQNPPLQEIDLSNNSFSKYGSWKLFVGNLRTVKDHDYMQFVLYPIPFHLQIFSEDCPDLPVKRLERQSKILFRSPTLTQEIIQESASRSNVGLTEQNLKGIRIFRKISSGKPLPKTYKEVASVTSMKEKLGKLVKDKGTQLIDIHKACVEISGQTFGFPSTALEEINGYIWEKLNQALLVRDHEAIGLLKASAQLIELDLAPYKDRLAKVERRKQIYISKLMKIYNFELGDLQINRQLDEMIKEAFRLSLSGQALNILFYLKDLRDSKIVSFLKQQYNPLPELEQLKTSDYAAFFNISEGIRDSLDIPHQLKQRKDINQNLFIHHLQANYLLLSLLSLEQYQKTIAIVGSVRVVNQKYVQFLKTAEDRANFIMNEFYQTFNFSTFKISYAELKINTARLLWQYRNVRRSVGMFYMPNFTRRKAVTPEKFVKLTNKPQFIHDYDINKYDNIRYEAEDAGITGWKGQYVKYTGPDFTEEVNPLISETNLLLQLLCTFSGKVSPSFVQPFYNIVKHIRTSRFPEELAEEFYLHLICFEESNTKTTEMLVRLMPFITMYLKPPLCIEKQLIAYLAKRDFLFTYMPLAVEAVGLEEQPPEAVEKQYVERDWFPKEKHAMMLIQTYGKCTVNLVTPSRSSMQFNVYQSCVVGDLMDMVYRHQQMALFADRNSFWIYRYNTRTRQEQPLDTEDIIGEVLSELAEEQELLVHRRVYSPYFTINYRLYSAETLDSLFHEIKFSYLRGVGYRAYNYQLDIASLLAVIAVSEKPADYKLYVDNLDKYLVDLFPPGYLLEKSEREILKALKTKVNERLLKEEQKNPLAAKKKFLDRFRDQAYYCASNYQLFSESHQQDCLLSVNSMYICIETQASRQYIFLESLVRMVPAQGHFLMWYYRRERAEVVELSFVSKQRQTVNLIVDILSYCVLRIKTPNMFVYLQRELYGQLIKNDISISVFDYEKDTNLVQVKRRLSQARQDLGAAYVNDLVNSLHAIMVRLEGLELVVSKQKDLIFHLPNLFVKKYNDRRIYPFKLGKKLQLSEPLGKMPESHVLEKLKSKQSLQAYKQSGSSSPPIKPQPVDTKVVPALQKKPSEPAPVEVRSSLNNRTSAPAENDNPRQSVDINKAIDSLDKDNNEEIIVTKSRASRGPDRTSRRRT